jgi:hypothetical protein
MTDAYEPREDEVVEDSQSELHPEEGRPGGIVRAATDRNAPFSNHKHEMRIKLFLPPRLAGLIVFTEIQTWWRVFFLLIRSRIFRDTAKPN